MGNNGNHYNGVTLPTSIFSDFHASYSCRQKNLSNQGRELTLPRILLVLTEFPPRIGGMQTHAAYLARHLAQNGYAIEVFTYRSSAPDVVQEEHAHDCEQPFVIYRILGRLSYQHNLDLLAQHASRFKPDLIYSSTVFYGILQSQLGIPVACRCVGNDVMRPWLGYPYRIGSRLLNWKRLDKLLHLWIEKDLYPDWVEALFRRKRERLAAASACAASHIFANSDFTAHLLGQLQVAAARVQVVAGGVDSRRFENAQEDRSDLRLSLGLPPSGYLLLTACRLVKKKGIDFLLEAVPALDPILPNVHLVVVGDGKYKSRYEKLCAERGIGNVSFVGRVPHHQIHRYYAACDLFVLASKESVNPLTGTRDVETMGRVLCEANAAGIAVIASRSGGIPSIIADGDNGLLFETGNQDQFIEKLRYLKNNPEIRARLVARGLSRAREEFDWSGVLHAHELIFAQLCRSHPQSARPPGWIDNRVLQGLTGAS